MVGVSRAPPLANLSPFPNSRNMVLKLTYFNVRGYGEYIRTLLIDNAIEFVDERIEGADWPKLKAEMPLGQMPVLVEGEKTIPQTGAILRHLARTHGLYGETECDRTFLDVFFDTIRDMRTFFNRMAYGAWEKKEEFDKEGYPTELQKLEKLFAKHNEGKGFILGEKISFADYVLYEELDLALASNAKNLDTVPLLKAFHQRFSQRPKLQEYFKKRAADKTPFTANGHI